VARLDSAQRRLATGDLSVRVPDAGAGGEIGRLLHGFNQTAASLESMTAELRALNAGLEQRVAARTAELNDALRKTEHQSEALARASEMKSQFLATMSHELRTPLNAIIGFAEVMKDGLTGELTAEQKSFVADIHASGRHLLDLINDILDLSKVEAGMMTLEPEPVDAAAVLQGGLTMVRERAMKHGLHLALDVEPQLPLFAADLRKLKQMVFNLLSNAVKFTPNGGHVRISAKRVARAQIKLPDGRAGRVLDPPASGAQSFVQIAVEDDGIGIAEQDMQRLFTPFMQIDSSLARQHQGTGLGLALVRRLAELHGGTVGVASAPGRGSAFVVWLPLAEAPVRAAPATTSRPQPRERAAPVALIVEDDDQAAGKIEHALREEGFRCLRAATAEDGLVTAAREHPDLIRLDVFLPQMDGWEFLERLQSDRDLAGVPVVIVSIAAGLEFGLALGATRVLQKPFTKLELQAALAGLVPPCPQSAHGTVLIVDDNAQAVELLAGYLAGTGYHVLRAYGGKEAVRTARTARPDLVLLDLMMPDTSGFDVVAQLKSDAATDDIPIVIVTAKDVTAEDRSALNGSVERILAKTGMARHDLVAEVRRALHRETVSG
jgi:signal transduction histidine kinase/DNA-binding response OmpR family regulator